MADLIAINKADGSNLEKAEIAKMQYQNALHLFPKKDSDWEPKVVTCSSLNKKGIAGIWENVESFRKLTTESKYFFRKRSEQSTFWMRETIDEQMKRAFYQHPEIKVILKDFEQKVLNDEMSSFAAAGKLLEFYKNMK